MSDLLPREISLSGMRIDNGSAELFFYSKDDAEKAQSIFLNYSGSLNQTKIQGRSLKAQLLDNLNDGLKLHKGDQYKQNVKKSQPDHQRSTQMMIEHSESEASSREERPNEVGKPSILKRIKKNR